MVCGPWEKYSYVTLLPRAYRPFMSKAKSTEDVVVKYTQVHIQDKLITFQSSKIKICQVTFHSCSELSQKITHRLRDALLTKGEQIKLSSIFTHNIWTKHGVDYHLKK